MVSAPKLTLPPFVEESRTEPPLRAARAVSRSHVPAVARRGYIGAGECFDGPARIGGQDRSPAKSCSAGTAGNQGTVAPAAVRDNGEQSSNVHGTAVRG